MPWTWRVTKSFAFLALSELRRGPLLGNPKRYGGAMRPRSEFEARPIRAERPFGMPKGRRPARDSPRPVGDGTVGRQGTQENDRTEAGPEAGSTRQIRASCPPLSKKSCTACASVPPGSEYGPKIRVKIAEAPDERSCIGRTLQRGADDKGGDCRRDVLCVTRAAARSLNVNAGMGHGDLQAKVRVASRDYWSGPDPSIALSNREGAKACLRSCVPNLGASRAG